jgi:hypothetical protein
MVVRKEISKDNELYLYMNGKVIYKRWLNTGQSLVFDVMAYDKYTYASYTDLDVKDSPHSIAVRARVRFKTFEEGGRDIGVYSGYRPNHFFSLDEADDSMECFMGDLQFEEPAVLELGQDYEIEVRFILSQRIEPYLSAGKKWLINEGGANVGFGEIISFVPPTT